MQLPVFHRLIESVSVDGYHSNYLFSCYFLFLWGGVIFFFLFFFFNYSFTEVQCVLTFIFDVLTFIFDFHIIVKTSNCVCKKFI